MIWGIIYPKNSLREQHVVRIIVPLGVSHAFVQKQTAEPIQHELPYPLRGRNGARGAHVLLVWRKWRTSPHAHSNACERDKDLRAHWWREPVWPRWWGARRCWREGRRDHRVPGGEVDPRESVQAGAGPAHWLLHFPGCALTTTFPAASENVVVKVPVRDSLLLRAF